MGTTTRSLDLTQEGTAEIADIVCDFDMAGEVEGSGSVTGRADREVGCETRQDAARVSINREIERAAQIDALQIRRGDSSQLIRIDGLAQRILYFIKSALHVSCVPGHQDIRKKC